MVRFANLTHCYLVWDERPCHVRGELFVIQPQKPELDPFCEKITWIDLLARTPRFPTKLLNHEFVANVFTANNIGTLVKLDQNSLLRKKIRFARARIRVNINETLLYTLK